MQFSSGKLLSPDEELVPFFDTDVDGPQMQFHGVGIHESEWLFLDHDHYYGHIGRAGEDRGSARLCSFSTMQRSGRMRSRNARGDRTASMSPGLPASRPNSPQVTLRDGEAIIHQNFPQGFFYG
jgi:hypothetical protein